MKRYDTYTESGISWIGKIPSHWEMRKLSQLSLLHFKSNKDIQHQNLLSLSYGRIIRKDVNTTSGLLPTSYNTYQIINEGNIVLRLTDLQNDKRSLRVGLCQEEGIITSAYLALEPRESVLPEYLYLLLHCADIKKVFYGMGNGLRQNLNWNELRRLEVVLPPQEEQEAIVAYLDEKCAQIDRYVASLEERIERLGELHQALIAETVTRGINPQAPLRPSGIPWLGEIPQHWEMRKLRQLIELFSDKGHPNEQLLSVVRELGVVVRNVDSKEENHNYIPDDLSGYKRIRKGDFAINKMKAWQGSYAVSGHQGIVSPAYYTCHLRLKNKEFFNMAIRSQAYVPFFTQNSKGIRVGQWDLSPVGLKEIPFFLPPQAEQEAIVAYLDEKTTQIDRYTGQLEEMIRQMRDLRQTIISEAVTGKICVLPN